MVFDKVFDKVPFGHKATIPQHLVMEAVKGEASDYSAPADAVLGHGSVPPAQARPTPAFISNPKRERTENVTIPWETPAGKRGGREDGRVKASHHHHHQVVEMANVSQRHDHLCHLPPAPLSCSSVSSCLNPAQAAATVTRTTVWCHKLEEMDCRMPPTSTTGCLVGLNGAASPDRQCRRDTAKEKVSPRFRRTTRAELRRRSPEQGPDDLISKFAENDDA